MAHRIMPEDRPIEIQESTARLSSPNAYQRPRFDDGVEWLYCTADKFIDYWLPRFEEARQKTHQNRQDEIQVIYVPVEP